MLDRKVKAICNYVKEQGYDLTLSEIKDLNTMDDYDYIELEALGQEFRVLDEDETEQAWVEAIEDHIHDCIFYQIPLSNKSYFDCNKFIQEAKSDGVDRFLGDYYAYKIDGEWINIFIVE